MQDSRSRCLISAFSRATLAALWACGLTTLAVAQVVPVTQSPPEGSAGTASETAAKALPQPMVAVSADGRYILLSHGLHIRLWDLTLRKSVRSFQLPESSPECSASRMQAMSFSADGHRARLEWMSQCKWNIVVRDLDTGRDVARTALISGDTRISIDAEDFGTRALAILTSRVHPTQNLGASDLVTGKNIAIPDSKYEVAMALSANGATLVTEDFPLEHMGPRVRAALQEYLASSLQMAAGYAGTLGQKAFDMGGAAALESGKKSSDVPIQFVVRDVASGRKLFSVPSSMLNRFNGMLSDDGSEFFTLNEDGSIDCYELPSGAKHRIVPATTDPSRIGSRTGRVNIAPNGKVLARTTLEGTIDIYDVPSGQLRLSLKPTDVSGKLQTKFAEMYAASNVLWWLLECGFSPDGRLFAVRDATMEDIRAWEISSGKMLLEAAGATFAFTPDGRSMILARYHNESPILRNLESGKEDQFPGPPDPIVAP